MPQFRYEGRDESGNVQTGVLESPSLEAARKVAYERVRWLTVIEPLEGNGAKTAGGFSLAAILASLGISATNSGLPAVGFGALAWFLVQFREQLRAGITPADALHRLASRHRGHFAKVLRDLAHRTAHGELVSSAMGHHPHVFSQDLRQCFWVGETEGKIAEYVEPFITIYKAADVMVKMVAGWLLGTFVVSFVWWLLYGRPYESVRFVDVVVFWLYLACGIVLQAGIWVLYCTLVSRYSRDWLRLCVPGGGRRHRHVVVGRLLQTMGRQYAAGIPMSQAIENAAAACGNEVIAQAARIAALRVRAGERADTALTSLILFPPYARQLLAVAQETGEFKSLGDSAAWHAVATTDADEPYPTGEPHLLAGFIEREPYRKGDPIPEPLYRTFLEWLFIRGIGLAIFLPVMMLIIAVQESRNPSIDWSKGLSPLLMKYQLLLSAMLFIPVGLPLLVVGIFAWNVAVAVCRMRRGEPV